MTFEELESKALAVESRLNRGGYAMTVEDDATRQAYYTAKSNFMRRRVNDLLSSLPAEYQDGPSVPFPTLRSNSRDGESVTKAAYAEWKALRLFAEQRRRLGNAPYRSRKHMQGALNYAFAQRSR